MVTNTAEIGTSKATVAIEAFVRADRLAKQLASELKVQEGIMKANLDKVLSQIGSGRAVYVDDERAILTPRESVKVQAIDDEKILAYWDKQGLKVSERSPRYVAPASLRSEVLKGNVPFELYNLTETFDVNVI